MFFSLIQNVANCILWLALQCISTHSLRYRYFCSSWCHGHSINEQWQNSEVHCLAQTIARKLEHQRWSADHIWSERKWRNQLEYTNLYSIQWWKNKGATNCIIRGRSTMLFTSCISLSTDLFICETKIANWRMLWIVIMTSWSLLHIVAVFKFSCLTDYLRILFLHRQPSNIQLH